ncbi:MAG TPA: C13 family peptidase [Stellaceae bacterium]|jgi:hypothetical protein|nr:C13 family peptidase [Stellaceae bacterium]
MIRHNPLRPLFWLCALALLFYGATEASAADRAPLRWQAVLVAGDDSQPVFDNAVEAFTRWLSAHGAAADDIHRLSAAAGPRHPGSQPASASAVLQTIASLHPQAGEGCLVFVTSHGQHGEGVWLAYTGEFLRPAALAQALSKGCGKAPTIVVISACYSGSFAAGKMRAPNRIILTAARPDRPSFGCQADRTYTVFDECLLGALPNAASWRGLREASLSCVREREHEMEVLPSQPQAFFGAAARNLRLR